MITLHESNEKYFHTLGIGVLRDVISCVVTEELNEKFELEMEYPINGRYYENIGLRKFLMAKPNMYDKEQPFRIYSITKPINGKVTINAEHISYDMSGYTIKPFKGNTLKDTLANIKKSSLIDCPFDFEVEEGFVDKEIKMETSSPFNMRALLAGGDKSILGIYGGDYKFDKFKVKYMNSRGKNNNVTIRYGKNMTSIDHESTSTNFYTGIFPFYYSVNQVTEPSTGFRYQHGYIVEGETPLTSDWLDYSPKGNGVILKFIPVPKDAPIEIQTPGDYYLKVYKWHDKVPKLVKVSTDVDANSPDWLYLVDSNGLKIINEDMNKEEDIFEVYEDDDSQSLGGKKFFWRPNPVNFKWLEIGKKRDGYWKIPMVDGVYKPPLKWLLGANHETREVVEYTDLTTGTYAYVIDAAVPFSSGWLSNSPGGDAIDTGLESAIEKIYLIESTDKIVNDLPTCLKGTRWIWVPSEDKYVQMVPDDTQAYVIDSATPYSRNWLSSTLDNQLPLQPNKYSLYVANSMGEQIVSFSAVKELRPGEYGVRVNANKSLWQTKDISVKVSYSDSFGMGYEETLIVQVSGKVGTKMANIPPNISVKGFKIDSFFPTSVTEMNGVYSDGVYKWNGNEYESINRPEQVFPEGYDKGILYKDEIIQNGMPIEAPLDRNISPQKLMTLDLTQEFASKPTVEELKAKAIEFLENNNIKDPDIKTRVSFVKLSDTSEYDYFKDLDRIELGDTVQIIYEKSNIEIKLKVISTQFNVVADKYKTISLGKIMEDLSYTAITTNDTVSSLSDGDKYPNRNEVKKIVVDTYEEVSVANQDTMKSLQRNLAILEDRIEQLERGE